MRKVIVRKPGSFDRLELVTVPDPVPDDDDVVVRAQACGVNYADCIVRMGLYSSATKYVGWPITPGFEAAGEVVAVGARVRDVRVGARVMVATRFGGYATHVKVPRRQVWELPEGFSFEQAAAFPSVFLTAWYALVELANVRAGMRVLVHSAAGGVGGAMCQLLRVKGCKTVGVVGRTDKVEEARRQGADVVIDKSKEDLWRMARRASPDGYDVICDANGVATLEQSWEHLRSPGRLVVYGFHTMMGHRGKPSLPKLAFDWARTPRFNPFEMTEKNRSVLAFNLSYMFDEIALLTEGLDQLLAWVREKRIAAQPVRTFPLDRVEDAHRAIESGTTVGKLVLVP
jgi:NADPH:quinone reductase-like Zn-dependent oxidoreductase